MCPKGNPNKWPTYTVFYGTSASGPFTSTVKPASDGYVQVTVTWTFNTITNYPAVPTSVNLSRSTVMKMSPAMPNFP
jgi:hypothetical protein